ncbi:hypothetical protein HYS90_00750 [Candidatus Curtissbacteria bacterium]|nr:hypothetical protein [Candidatus Curtissbacteria bacterium]
MGKETEARFRGNFIQRTVRNWLRRRSLSYEVIGIENLTGINKETGEQKPHNLKALLDQGETATILPSHPSRADFPTNAAIVAKEEELQDFMGTLVMSNRYTNNPLLGLPIRAIAYSLDLRVESVNPHKYGGDKKKSKMNTKAKERVRQSQVGIAVMQGTHSVEMQSARWGSVCWWEDKSYIVPVAFRGTDLQWSGSLFTLPYYLMKGKTEHKATLLIGEPVRVSYLERVAEVYSQGDPDPNALTRNRVDFPTQLIVNLHNEYVHQRGLEDDPEETKYTKGYYEIRLRELAEHPVSVGIRELARMGEVVPKQQEVQEEKAAEKERVVPKPVFRPSPGWI